jgi:FkbM family methyltransferase
MMPQRLWLGESLRWYLRRARHPGKPFIVGHYWALFCRPRVWIRYDSTSTLSICLADYVQQRIFFEGYYERRLVDWLKETLRPTDVFWDVGANIGAITLVASRLCRRVVAFEPDPRSIRLLEWHLHENGVMNAQVMRVALGDVAGPAVLHQAPAANTGMTSLVPNAEGATGPTIVTSVMRADDVLAGRPELVPDVIKIDVEGAEALVLRGAAGLLAHGAVRAVVFEDDVNAAGAPANQRAVQVLVSAGYRIAPLGRSDDAINDGKQNFVASLA